MSARHVLDEGCAVGLRLHDDGSSLLTIGSDHAPRREYALTRERAVAMRDLLGCNVAVLVCDVAAADDAGTLRAQLAAAHAEVADVTRKLADAATYRRDAVIAERDRCLAALRNADRTTPGSPDYATVLMRAEVLIRGGATVDPQPPHGGGTDERVVVGEGTVHASAVVGDGVVFVSGPAREGGPRPIYANGTALFPHVGRRARFVVELLPAAAVDAQQGVGQERSEGAGGVGGGEHRDANVTATTGAEKSGAQ